MVDSDSDLRQAGGLSLLALRPARFEEQPTMQIPMLPGLGDENLPRVEPRSYGPNGPVWDATDEIFITYDEEGVRAIVTTGADDIWNREHSYQRTGSNRYSALRSLGTVGGRVGQLRRGLANAGANVKRRLPAWAGGTGEYPEIHLDRDREHPRPGPRRRARGRAQDHGEGPDGAERNPWGDTLSGGVPERPVSSAEQRIRSHRHCPGCAGHANTRRSGGGSVLRLANAWLLGWFAVWGGGLDLGFLQYVLLTSLGFWALALLRPVWREFTNADDRYTKGGRR